jgi:hypothetical protein
LLELSLVLVLFSVVVLLSMATVMGALRIEQATAAAFNRQTRVADLADQFRTDVAQATAAPERLDQLSAGPACLILGTAAGGHIVYRWEANRLERTEWSGSSAAQKRVLAGPECGAVAFSRSGKDHPTITLRLLQTRPPGKVKRPLDISAALGGDHR